MLDIKLAKSEIEYTKCFNFIKDMWFKEFEIDFSKNIEKQHKGFLGSKVYYIEENGLVIAVIQLAKIEGGTTTRDGFIPKDDCYFLWRIGVSKKSRGNGYGTHLINEAIKLIESEGINLIYLSSEVNNIRYYESFGFRVVTGEEKIIGNTKAVHMERINKKVA